MNKNVELSVHQAFVDEARGYRFEPLRDEKGKKVYRHPRVGEWYITEDAEIARHPWCEEDDERGQILRAIPINPTPDSSAISDGIGYRVSLPIHSRFKSMANGLAFFKSMVCGEWERRRVGYGDWFVVVHEICEERIEFWDARGSRSNSTYFVLKAIPVSPSCSTCSHEYEPKMETVAPAKPVKQWKKGEWAFHPEYKLLYVASETDIHGEPGFIFHPLNSGNTNVIISGHHLDVLREVEDSDWPVGALVMYYYDHLIPSQIMGVSSQCGIHIKNEFVHGFSRWVDPKHIRPIQDSDWIVEIDGVKYRAFEIGSRHRRDNIELRQSTSEYTINIPVTPEIVKALGVPVMPLEFQKR
jgi:hypothetical protein